MPVHLSTNRLLSWLVGLFVAYWSVGLLSHPLWYSGVISSALLVGGTVVAFRAIPDAYSVVRKDQIGPGELAVIALALISAGAVWTGTFNIVYAWQGRPLSWIGPASSFGRAMIALGFFVLFLSPEASRQGVRWPRWYILVAGAVLIAAVSFVIGYTVSQTDGRSTLLFDTSKVPVMTDLLMHRRA